MGSTTDTSLTNMIQDAILKLCTHNITFTKSLEIDGIICVSPGEAQPDIVVKMHRTILKPQTKPDPPVKSWDETYNTNPNPHPFTTGYTLPQVSYPQGDQRMSYASAIPDRSRTFVRNTNTGSPRNRRTHTTHTAATHEQPEVEFATHDPTQENLSTPGETIPVATQMTPVGLAETSAQGPEDSLCSRSEEEEQQTSLTSKNPDNKRKVESETFSNDDPPDKQAKIEIKEEPITIEVNDEDDDINDGDMNTGDWMQDNTLDSLDNTAEQNGNTQQQMQGTDPNSDMNVSLVNMFGMPHMCHICGEAFSSRNNLQRHIGGKHNPSAETFSCDQCEKQYKRKEHLFRHIQCTHLPKEENKHTCQTCDQTFSRKDGLKRHESLHSDNKYFCEICLKLNEDLELDEEPRSFKNKEYLQKHIRFFHDPSKELFVCVCKKKYKYEQSLKKHFKKCHQSNVWNR